ncbi:MAG: response regulator [Desulfobacterales bacterium]|nr:response regulator [Desulfobacterales bacterium]
MVDTEQGPGKTKIMIVGDVPQVLSVLTEMLERSDFAVVGYANLTAALAAAGVDQPDLILLDILTPGIEDCQICERLKQVPRLRDVPVIFISGLNITESKIKAFHLGGVDYITKPFHFEEVEARVRTHVKLHLLQKRLVARNVREEEMRQLLSAQQEAIIALARLAQAREEDTGRRLERIREYCRLLAEALRRDSQYSAHISADFIACMQQACPLHDIGKATIPDSILLKPGKLTPAEFEVIKTHTDTGAANLEDVCNNYPQNTVMGMGIEIALHHHEWWDGSGYPTGLAGVNIPLSARIMALADCYDALRSDRCYRRGFAHEPAKTMIMQENGTHFDPEICKAFLALERDFEKVMERMG